MAIPHIFIQFIIQAVYRGVNALNVCYTTNGGIYHMLNPTMQNKIIDRLTSVAQPEKIILFGSYCRNMQKQDSDIDLFIIQRTDESVFKRSTVYRRALLDMGLSFDVVVRTPDEIEQWQNVKDSFIHTVLSEGKVIYER
jgi:uncharacterized protein